VVGPYTYTLFLLRVPLIATIALVGILSDFILPGAMREALRYSILDASQQLPIVSVVLFFTCFAIRATGEATIELVSPDLYGEKGGVGFFAHAIPRLFAILVGAAPGIPLLKLCSDGGVLGANSSTYFEAGAFGALFIAIGLFVGLVLKLPETIRGDAPARGPSFILRWVLALLPLALAILFVGVVLGFWQDNNGIAADVGYYRTAFATVFEAGSVSLRVLAETAALFLVCVGARVAIAVTLDLLFPGLASSHGLGGSARAWLPRFASLGVALALVAQIVSRALKTGVSMSAHDGALQGMVQLAIICLIFLLVGVVASIGGGRNIDPARRLGARWLAAASQLTMMSGFWQWTFAFCLVLGIAIFLAFVDVTQVRFAQSIGPIAVLLLWGFTATSLFSPLAYLGHVTKIPLLLILTVSGVAYAGFDLNDDHELRHLPGQNLPAGTVTSYRENLEIGSWLASRQDWQEYDHYPIFLVATEGGGIRAAYFTATVLSALEERCPAFAQHTIAISGVSGGSLGSAVFAALAADYAHNAPHQRCNLDGRDPGSLERQTRAALSSDLLSPLLGATLFPDALQRILPVHIDPFDRSRALEAAVEDSYRAAALENCPSCDKDRMAQEVGELYHWKASDARPAVPHLLLNTTEAGTGRSIPYATVELGTLITPTLENPEVDYMGELTSGFYSLQSSMKPEMDHIPLSSAALISARFPYLTPAGRTGVRGRHYVDGGYWENSGTSLVAGIIQNLIGQQMGYSNPANPKLEDAVRNAVVVTIVVHSEPCTRSEIYGECGETNGAAGDDHTFNEVLSPIRALLYTRDKRADYAINNLTALTATIEQLNGGGTTKVGASKLFTGERDDTSCYGGACEVTLRYCNKPGVEVPVSWLLSHAARDAMNDAVTRMEKASLRAPPAQGTRTLECNDANVDDGNNKVLGSYRRVVCLLDAKAGAQSCLAPTKH
jgi:hypothetical protein